MTRYFEYFPEIAYQAYGGVVDQVLTNIVHKVRFRKEVVQNISVFYIWIVKDGDTPEIVATKYYGNPNYHWLVMHSNAIIDPYFDWCLPQNVLNNWLIDTYGSIETAMQTNHHYEDKFGIEIDTATYQSLPSNERSSISVYDHWVKINEAKRNIRLIDKTYLPQILEEMELAFKNLN